eukprot:6370171-Prymnesium_polylepis.1
MGIQDASPDGIHDERWSCLLGLCRFDLPRPRRGPLPLPHLPLPPPVVPLQQLAQRQVLLAVVLRWLAIALRLALA